MESLECAAVCIQVRPLNGIPFILSFILWGKEGGGSELVASGTLRSRFPSPSVQGSASVLFALPLAKYYAN